MGRIMTNRPDGTLPVAVTKGLSPRAWEHREGLAEVFPIKQRPRSWRFRIISAQNPGCNDPYEKLL